MHRSSDTKQTFFTYPKTKGGFKRHLRAYVEFQGYYGPKESIPEVKILGSSHDLDCHHLVVVRFRSFWIIMGVIP